MPTGTIEFQSDGTTIPGCGSKRSMPASRPCTTDTLDAGTHAITADYSGSDSYTGSATPLDQTVDAAATSTQVLTDLNPSAFGDTVTVTATVTGVPNGEVPTGSVQFTIDGVDVGGPVTLAAGSASLPVSDLDAGDHTVAANLLREHELHREHRLDDADRRAGPRPRPSSTSDSTRPTTATR